MSPGLLHQMSYEASIPATPYQWNVMRVLQIDKLKHRKVKRLAGKQWKTQKYNRILESCWVFFIGFLI